jgi:hypothetical protein
MKITFEQVKELIPTRVSMYYVDYRNSLDESLELVQDCIHEGNYDTLYEKTDEWFLDADGGDYYLKELERDLAKKYELETDDAEEIVEHYLDKIMDVLWDRNDSTPTKDLMSNTNKTPMFYDTGYYMDGDSWAWTEKQVIKERQLIKKALGLRAIGEGNDAAIDMMIRQASYGGKIVLYFYDNPTDWIGVEGTTIKITNPIIACIDTSGGSGDHCDLEACSIKLPFEKENLFICSTIKYNYSFSVCGMIHNWCDSSSVELIKAKTKKTVGTSSLTKEMAREKELTKIFKSGSCTYGDMDIARHRDVEYINDYPCRNQCPNCKTAWID